jgi:predicted nucleotidyltransferase component of viral defense system
MGWIFILKKLPDLQLLTDVAIELGVERSFIEKDWYVVQVIEAIAAINSQEVMPVFTGGTCLSKAYHIIKRFSEDVDFRLKLNLEKIGTDKAKIFKRVKQEIISMLHDMENVQVNEDAVFAANENKFFRIPLKYTPVIEIPHFIRNELLLEFSFSDLMAEPQNKTIRTLMSELSAADEGISIPCVSSIEIAADKLSAIVWRVLQRDRAGVDDDPRFIRHLYDLYALKNNIEEASNDFWRLFTISFSNDQSIAKRNTALSMKESLESCIDKLSQDRLYKQEYADYVMNMSYEKTESQASFDMAINFLQNFCQGHSWG